MLHILAASPLSSLTMKKNPQDRLVFSQNLLFLKMLPCPGRVNDEHFLNPKQYKLFLQATTTCNGGSVKPHQAVFSGQVPPDSFEPLFHYDFHIGWAVEVEHRKYPGLG